MNEQDIINQTAKDKAALDKGDLTPSRVQKVMKHPNGSTELVDIPALVLKAATRLRKARADSDMTQMAFAELLGVPISTYRNYEQYITEVPPPVLKLAAIAAIHPELIDAA
jgi:DNA-binding transcriptional regulator YiaG